MAEVAGWVGALALLAGYALLSLGRIPSGGRYHVFNLVGAAGLIVNGAAHGAWPSTMLNVVWVAIGGVALARLHRRPEPGSRWPTRPRPERAP
ncbi:CBU_0592 family membrane protein [Cryptosporangium arvum]|uniref:CBU_0592 family membrane protein n=1 Tax=Cryptosporangium arvum TaxID=80871 RepID=UPI0004B999A3|nr:hypothetical protein [Cryptosporangium arvum]